MKYATRTFLCFSTFLAVAAVAGAAAPLPGPSDPAPPAAVPQTSSAQPAAIVGLSGGNGPIDVLETKCQRKCSAIGVGGELLVRVTSGAGTPSEAIDPRDYVLFLNGREVSDSPEPTYDSECQCLTFRLRRTENNASLWASLIGSPTAFQIPVTVSLGVRQSGDNSSPRASIFAAKAGASTFNLETLSAWRLAVAFAVLIAVIVLVWGHARRNATFRDNLLPQLAPERQPYSLARWQMAFWFTLIFSCFFVLLLLLGDFNTINTQALVLMGLSGGTAAGSVAVDAAKDSPADAVNRGLVALGLISYADVCLMKDEIRAREIEIKALTAAPAQAAGTAGVAPSSKVPKLNVEIQDRLNILRVYEDKTDPFESQGWFKDLTTDLNGTALHRLQAFCWTWVLGGVFVVGIYRDLAMPEFSLTLLALMGISSAGYVGMKIQESNN